MIKNILLVWACMFSGCCIACHAITVTDPENIIIKAKKMGEKNYVSYLLGSPEKWNYVLLNIEDGNNKWLTVARMLRHYTDASATAALKYSVSIALKNAPEHVLAILGKEYTVQEICGSPFIEEDIQDELGFLRTIKYRVENTKNETKHKQACLNNIDQQITVLYPKKFSQIN